MHESTIAMPTIAESSIADSSIGASGNISFPKTPPLQPHEPTQRQRLMTFGAAHSRFLFPIAEMFADRFGAAFPAARGMFHLNTKTQRFNFACAVSSLCKSIDQLESAGPAIRFAERELASRGFTAEHIPMARACFLASMREHAGESWNSRIERDWCDVADRFFGCITLPEAKARPMRMAA